MEQDGVRAKFLQKCKDKRIEVTIFMRNGFRMRGVVVEFDEDAMTANVDGVEKLLSQAAVSTIEPARNYAPRQHYVGDWPSPAREFIRP